MRNDGRQPNQLRPLQLLRRFTTTAPGSVLVRTGETHVLCTASIASEVPEWRASSGAGWLTAEYDMLPGSTAPRKSRSRKSVPGRTQEIQRLIGRSLRAAVNLDQLGQHTIHIDCDVLQADGGTRTAAITGAYVALQDALAHGIANNLWPAAARNCAVAATSVGIVDGQILLDLDYSEDSRADVDCNLVMTDAGAWIEIQSTAEQGTFSSVQLQEMLALGEAGIRALFQAQSRALADN